MSYPPFPPYCFKCGSRESLQEHHPCGRNHYRYFTVLLCARCHKEAHVAYRAAGVDLRYTSDPVERRRRAHQALLVFQWWLLEEPEKWNFNSEQGRANL